MNPVVFQTKAVINTFVRLVPLGLYFGTLLMGILFTDIRAFVLLIGYLLNDVISYGFRQIYQTVDLVNCAIVQSPTNFYTMPSSHTQTVAFTLAYFFMDMYQKQNFNVVNFIFLGFMLLVTMWSRINIGCEAIIDSIFAVVIGVTIGAVYYRLTQSWNNVANSKDPQTLTQKSSSEVTVYQRL
jgi:membrane-associated phospholipid phosphatase